MIKLLVLSILAFLSPLLWAGETAPQHGLTIHFLEDQQTLTPKAAWDLYQDGKFQPMTQSFLRGSITNSPYWISVALDVKQGEDEHLYLQVINPYADTLALYEIKDEKPVLLGEQGDQVSMSPKQIFAPYPTFKVKVREGTQFFLMRYHAHSALSVPIEIKEETEYYTQLSKDFLLKGCILGALLIITGYNFFLYLSLRTRSFLYYSLYLLNVILATLVTTGYLKIFIFPAMDTFEPINLGYLWFSNIAGIFMGKLNQDFLELKTRYPRLNRWVDIIGVFLMIGTGLSLFHYGLGVKVSVVAGYVLINFLIFNSLLACFHRYRPAYIYTVSWLSPMVGAGIWLMTWFGIGVNIEQGFDILRVSILAESIIISIALANKINLEKRAARDRIEGQVKDIETLNTALKEEQAAKDRFFQNTSHELRTPLNGILGFARLLTEDRYGLIPASAKANIQKIHGLADSLKNLVNQILEISASKNHRGRSVLTEFALADVIDEMRSLCEGLSHHFADTSFTMTVSMDEQATFVTDYERLVTVLRNLISNGFKFKHPDRPNELNIHFELVEGKLKIAIKDRGRGIPENFQQKIFDEFFRLPEDNSNSAEGTGIGLSIVRQYIKELQGQITVRSDEQGSEFQLVIPALNVGTALLSSTLMKVTAQTDTQTIKLEQVNAGNTSDRQHTVLVVDDTDYNREIIRDTLSSEQYILMEADCGQAALDILSRSQVDLIILDLMMHDMQGEGILQHCRSHENLKAIPIIVITAKASDDNRLEVLQLGADEYLAKPIIPEELILRVKNVCSRMDLNREHLETARIHGEFEAARKIQSAFFPTHLDLEKFAINYRYIPAARVGGDWFGVFEDPSRQRLFVLMGDVTGHGLSSSLVTGVIHGIFKGMLHYFSHHQSHMPIEEVLRKLAETMNATLYEMQEQTDRAMTMLFIGMDYDSNQCTLIGAGHTPLILIQKDEVKGVLSPGVPLGIVEHPEYWPKVISFQEGDGLLLFTDGLLENRVENERPLSLKSLMKLLHDHPDQKNIQDLLVQITDRLSHSPQLEDDITYLLIQKRLSRAGVKNTG